MTTFDVQGPGIESPASINDQEKVVINAQTGRDERHALILRLSKEKQIAADQLTSKRRKQMKNIVLGVFQSMSQQRIWSTPQNEPDKGQGENSRTPLLSEGLRQALKDGYYQGAFPSENSLVREFSYPGGIDNFAAFINRLVQTKNLDWWAASNGVILQVTETFPPNQNSKNKRWHIQPQLVNNPNVWATIEAYEEQPDKTLVCFFDGYNAISEPHDRPRFGPILLELADFIESHLMIPERSTITEEEDNQEKHKLSRTRQLQITEISDAFLSAFPSEEDLEMMVGYKLDENLNHVVESGNLRFKIFKLIQSKTTDRKASS